MLQSELHFLPYTSTFIPNFQAEMETYTLQMAIFGEMYFCWMTSNPDQMICGMFFGQTLFFFHKLGTTRQYFLPFKCAKCHIRLLNLTDFSLYFYISWDVGFWIQFVSSKCKLCDFLVKSAFLFTNIHKPVAKKIGWISCTNPWIFWPNFIIFWQLTWGLAKFFL